MGQLAKQIAPKLGFPFTSFITVIGFLIGLFVTKEVNSMLYDAMYPWEHMDPHVMLALFMPALIFESAFKTDTHILKHSIGQVLIMAGPMLAVAIALTAVIMYYVLGYDEAHNFDFMSCLMFGSIVSATDPVAVVALLKELGASKRLSTIIEGESLFNDGTAFVCFLLF